MFGAARKQVALRIIEGRKLLSVAIALSSSQADIAATCRGLLFIQLYGAYEYAVTTAVQGALDEVQKHSLGYGQLRRGLLALVLDPKWRSAGQVGPKGLWDSRLALIEAMNDTTPIVNLNNKLFPADGSHYRSQQLKTIERVFGIKSPILPESRLIGRIHELVEKRNAIAHGRNTAREVGAGFTNGDMESRITDTDAIAQHVIDAMENHCLTGGLT